MKNILVLLIIATLSSCGGYKPIFSGENVNFYIEEINIDKENSISRKIAKKLRPYTSENSKKGIKLNINSAENERVISKDNKGDPLIFEITLEIIVDFNSKNYQEKITYTESFSYNNQSNKFDLNQYKKDLIDDLIKKIFEKLIIKLRAI